MWDMALDEDEYIPPLEKRKSKKKANSVCTKRTVSPHKLC